MNNNEVELELIIYGDVQGVGYRQYVKRVARKLNIKGHAKNLEDETVEIRCKGEIDNINYFKDKINVKNPLDAPLIEVDEIISEKSLPQGTITEKIFRVITGDINDELLDSNTTGINYLNLFRKEMGSKIDISRVETNNNLKEMNSNLGSKIDNGFSKTDDNFGKMDVKYKLISEEMFTLANKIDKRMEKLEERNEIVDTRMEKTEKNIEKLLEILIQQKI